MKTLKTIYLFFVGFVMAGVVFYLLGSLSAASFNLNYWPSETRGIVAFFIGLGGIAFGLFMKEEL